MLLERSVRPKNCTKSVEKKESIQKFRAFCAYRKPGCRKVGQVGDKWHRPAAFLCCTVSVRTPPCFVKKEWEEYADKVCYWREEGKNRKKETWYTFIDASRLYKLYSFPFKRKFFVSLIPQRLLNTTNFLFIQHWYTFYLFATNVNEEAYAIA